MTIKALIFDFDGLILETESPVYQSWQELYSSLGCELTFTFWADAIGKGVEDFDPFASLEAQLGYKVDRLKLSPPRRAREMELILSQQALPGVVDYLSSARGLGLKLGVASSSSRSWVAGHLERLGLLSYFDCIRASGDVARTKPHPDLYLAALDCLGVAANEAIAFEDSAHGILAAHRAGLYCVSVPNDLTRRLPLNHADLRLESLADLPLEELIAKVEMNS